MVWMELRLPRQWVSSVTECLLWFRYINFQNCIHSILDILNYSPPVFFPALFFISFFINTQKASMILSIFPWYSALHLFYMFYCFSYFVFLMKMTSWYFEVSGFESRNQNSNYSNQPIIIENFSTPVSNIWRADWQHIFSGFLPFHVSRKILLVYKFYN